MPPEESTQAHSSEGSHVTLSLNMLPAGIYFLQIEAGSHTVLKKGRSFQAAGWEERDAKPVVMRRPARRGNGVSWSRGIDIRDLIW